MSSSIGKEKPKRGGKKKAFVPLLDFSNNIVLPGRHQCDCEASRHKLINNCMSCGRIVCEQEGVGKCFTCDEFVHDRETQKVNEAFASNLAITSFDQSKENSQKKKTDKNKRDGIKNIAADLEKAVQHKNKLLEFDRTCEQRTRVIDDESDYFKLTSQHWLSEDKREKIEAKIDKLQEKKFVKDRTLTLDFANARFEENVTSAVPDVGKVVQEMEEDAAYKSDYQIVDSKCLNISEKLPCVSYFDREKKTKTLKKGKQSGPEKEKEKEIQRPKNSATTSTSFRGSIFSTSSRIQDPQLMEMSDSGVCLTIQQPWASLVISGIKLHEGRSWYTHYRGRIWIHASGKLVTPEEINDARKIFSTMTKDQTKFPFDYPRSLLLGCVTLKDCLSQEEYKHSFKNPYMETTYVWILEDPIQLKVKIPMDSKSNRLFNLEDQILKAASKQLDFSL